MWDYVVYVVVIIVVSFKQLIIVHACVFEKVLCFSEDGKTGSFVIGDDHFPASLLNLPCIVESYKTYDDNVLIKSADIGQVGLELIYFSSSVI